MNNFLYKKALVQPVIKNIKEIKLYKQTNSTNSIGIVYTIYNKKRKQLSIGYIDKIEDFKNYVRGNNFEILEQRLGTKRESELLKITLKEIGYSHYLNEGNYIYSLGLMSHLNLLGWPTGKNKLCKKKLAK